MSKIVREFEKTTAVKKNNSVPRKRKTSCPYCPANRILNLQRTIGNQAVQNMIRSGTLQVKSRKAYAAPQRLNTNVTPVVPSITAAPDQIQRLDVEDCSTEHAREVRTASAAALPAVRNTISAILGNTPAANATLKTYFGDSGPDHAASIGLRLAIIAHRLSGATVECENPGGFMYDHFCGGALAYVRPVPAFFGFGNIHLCQPGFHNLNARQQMATLVHEGAHRYIDADDEAYYTLDCNETAETRALSDSDRRDNADSYGCLVHALG